MSEGTYYTCRVHQEANLKKLLETYEMEFWDGAKHLRRLYERFNSLTPAQKGIVMEFFNSGKWRITKQNMKEQFTAVFQLMYPEEPTNAIQMDDATFARELGTAYGGRLRLVIASTFNY